MDGKPVCDSRDGKGDEWRESHDVMQELEHGYGKDPKRNGRRGRRRGCWSTGYNNQYVYEGVCVGGAAVQTDKGNQYQKRKKKF